MRKKRAKKTEPTTTDTQIVTRRAIEALRELEKLKQNIEANFLRLGELLCEIRDNRYYKVEGYVNFKDFIEARFDFGWRQGFWLVSIIQKAKALGLEDKLSLKGISSLKEIFSLDNKQEIERLLLLDAPHTEIKNIVRATRGNVKRIEYGEPINWHGLRYAPLNEQGVVYLFAMISKELGFTIEAIRTAFPDCVGKREIKGKRGRLEDVDIEFEYKSSDFLKHRHNIKGCNIIVCWEHDWKDCPIEVISLRNEVERLEKM